MMERSKCMNIPKVRFHGFKEKWREESLSKLFVERHEISTITESLPQLSFTISEGVIYPDDRKSNKRDFLIKDILSKKYLVTYVGDILYNPANVIYGAIHRNSLCNGVVSPIYKIFKTEQDSNFMECVVRNPSFISQLSMKTEGTVTKLKTLKPESFLEMIVKIAPSIDEQQKIASYFQSLDSLIQTISKKLASLKRIKAASLQSMFPQEGETVPKVRFKGFEGEWKKVPFRSLVTFYRGLTYTPSNIRQKGTRVLRSSNINDGFLELSDNDVFVESTCVNVIYAKKGDILITSANGSPKLVGKHAIIDKQDNSPMVAGGFMLLAKSNESEFINISMNSSWYEKFLRTGISGGNGSIGNLNKTYLEDYVIHIPSTKTERDKLASFFTNLDKQIILQTQRLEKLKQIKTACLDKMFV